MYLYYKCRVYVYERLSHATEAHYQNLIESVHGMLEKFDIAEFTFLLEHR
jgi:hypothetical protein